MTLIKALVYDRGTKGTNNYIELQVISLGDGYFNVRYVTETKLLYEVVYKLGRTKRTIRAFQALK